MQSISEVKAVAAEAGVCVDAAILVADRLALTIPPSDDFQELTDMLREAAYLLDQLDGEETGISP